MHAYGPAKKPVSLLRQTRSYYLTCRQILKLGNYMEPNENSASWPTAFPAPSPGFLPVDLRFDRM